MVWLLHGFYAAKRKAGRAVRVLLPQLSIAANERVDSQFLVCDNVSLPHICAPFTVELRGPVRWKGL